MGISGVLRIAVVLVALASGAPAHAGSLAATPTAKAELLWRQGYIFHTLGAYDEALRFFRRSIATRPTAEAHTFLGWSLSRLDRLEDAISECKKAIVLDPGFGNPYNDIGAYLSGLGRPDEAVPWLRKATRAGRYCCYQFPHYNIGRILLQKGRIEEARRSFRRALEFDPENPAARAALVTIDQEWM